MLSRSETGTHTRVEQVLILIAVFLSPHVSVLAAQDIVVQLRNGDRITGRLLAQETNHIVISTGWTKSLTLPISAINGFGTPAGENLFAAPYTPPPPIDPKTMEGSKPATKRALRGSVQIGSDIQYGARDREMVFARLKLAYEQPYKNDPKKFFRTFGDYTADYGETENVKSANRMTWSVKTDFDLDDKAYIYNVAGGGYDEIRRIDAHYEIGPGLGYRLIRKPKFTLNAEGGGNYQVQLRPEGDDRKNLFFRAADDLVWKLTPRLSFTKRFEFFINSENIEQYRFRLDSTFTYKLIDNLSLNFTMLDLYDTSPARNVDKNEFQVRSSLGLTF
jgi:putative salt-induced outer membrane protein YdiY